MRIGVGGLWGIIAIGLFAEKDLIIESFPDADPNHFGLFMGGGGKRLGVQILGKNTFFFYYQNFFKTFFF